MAIRYTNLPGNDQSRNDVQLSQDEKTKLFFNGYFDQEVVITGAEWDVVYSFFLKKTNNNPDAARSLSEAIITAADSNGDNPVDLIQELKQFDALNIDKVLALYLNESRRDTSLVGYSQTITPNKFVARNINA